VTGVGDLTWAVGELAELSTQEFDVDELLRRLCEVAVRSLPVDGVGVMKTDLDAAHRFVHASDPPLTELEQLQETFQEGPSRDAVDTAQVITAASVADMRWPQFATVAEKIGIHAVLVVPMTSRGRTFGTLDLYWRTEHHASDDDLAAAQLLANVAVSYLSLAAERAQSRAAQEQLAHQLLHDQLTGLPNRSLMEELIAHALAASDRTGAPVAVLFIDVDHFKRINDTYGHHAGDEVLQAIAHRMQAAVRGGDTVGRISGDEFIVLCEGINTPHRPGAANPPATTLAMLTAVGHRIRQRIAQPMPLRHTNFPITVTASVGIAVTTQRPTVTELIHTADQAMYRAKSSGGSDVVTLRHPPRPFKDEGVAGVGASVPG
jgi:diguanylate cyclase (GGDEF)-like protein